MRFLDDKQISPEASLTEGYMTGARGARMGLVDDMSDMLRSIVGPGCLRFLTASGFDFADPMMIVIDLLTMQQEVRQSV